MLGEGVEVFPVDVPPVIVGMSLAESGIGAKTGMVVLALETEEKTITNPSAGQILEDGTKLLMLGTTDQRERFSEAFGAG